MTLTSAPCVGVHAKKMQRIRVNKRSTRPDSRRFETQMGHEGGRGGGGGVSKTRVDAHWQISRATLASDKRCAIHLYDAYTSRFSISFSTVNRAIDSAKSTNRVRSRKLKFKPKPAFSLASKNSIPIMERTLR